MALIQLTQRKKCQMSGISEKEPLCGPFPYSTPETYERGRAMRLMLMLGKVPTK